MLDAIVQTADIVGALAVVATLVYVGIQVNDNTRVMRLTAANDAAALGHAWYLQLGSNPEATQIYTAGLTNPESLSREGMVQFIWMTHANMIALQNSWYLTVERALDPELRETLTNTILGIREQPGFAIYWSQRKALFKPEFRAYVEALVISGSTNKDFEQVFRRQEIE
jgi:hypothetical protein